MVTGKFHQNALSPKLGAVYQLAKDKVSLFANYMNGFQFVSGVDYSGNSFKPQYASQAEAGLKAELLNGRLSATVSYYDIPVTNATRTDTEHPGFSIQDGSQKSKGVEAELVANPLPGLNLVAGYGYNDSKLIKANAKVEGKRPSASGAYSTANAWLSYKLQGMSLRGLGIGAGINYSGEQYITNTTTAIFILPEFTTLDGTVFYDFKNFRIAAKADNITSTKYWSQYYLAPQPPAKYSISFSVKF